MEHFIVAQIEQSYSKQPDFTGLYVLAILAMVGLGIYFYWYRQNAKEEYETIYARFAANPLDRGLRDQALASADAYAKAVGGDSSEQSVHRTSLHQSIETLHRSAKENAEVKKLLSEKSVGPADRLAELQKMFDQGLISEQEFQTKRTQILDRV